MTAVASLVLPSQDSLVLGGERSEGVVAFEREMVGFFVDAAELLGVPKSIAAIYGIVFAAPEPLSFADIESRLDFSKGSISQGLRALREIGAIREVSPAESRIELFAPDLEMRRLIKRYIEQRLDAQLERGKKRLGDLKRSAKIFTSDQQEVINERVLKLQRWHSRTRALMPVVKTFLQLPRI